MYPAASTVVIFRYAYVFLSGFKEGLDRVSLEDAVWKKSHEELELKWGFVSQVDHLKLCEFSWKITAVS